MNLGKKIRIEKIVCQINEPVRGESHAQASVVESRKIPIHEGFVFHSALRIDAFWMATDEAKSIWIRS
jgi:hypothetical protein